MTKKIAIIQFGAADDVTKAYQMMLKKKQKEGSDVRQIDILKLNADDKIFLDDKNLYQINFVGHSSTWDEKGSLLAIKKRKIGASFLSEACSIVSNLAKTTTAIKFNFYPCEIGDKIDDCGVEIRELLKPQGILGRKEELSLDDISKIKSCLIDRQNATPFKVSSLDILTLAILEGRSQNNNCLKPVSIGGQVGPGDPQHADSPGSPRKSIVRELAWKIVKGDKSSKLEASSKADKVQAKQIKKDDQPVVWVEQHYTLFKSYTGTVHTLEMEDTPPVVASVH